MEQHSAHDASAGQADIFDMEARHNAPHSHAQTPPYKNSEPPRHKPDIIAAVLDRIVNLSPKHMVWITLAIISIGLVWPRLTAPPSTPPNNDSQLLPTQFHQPAAQPVPERTMPKPAADSVPVASPLDGVPQQAVPATESERAIIRTALEDLHARVTRLETNAAQTSATAAAAAPVVAPVGATGKIRSQSGPRTPEAKRPYANGRAHPLPTLDGYSLNTIYQNQAWIEHNGATFAVQVGDKIGSLTITGIDARGRRVITPSGQIR